ncbi:mediator complex, subunit Med11 [Chaetomium strumarium]|uniref:Mediator of RNA polymerase II transcription subunit 11 n=1 Tax=Chaetomium strumarium TaxID=1170767 RepID=A0AAJ0GY42_9PEZI|nr:mediator complex, subunit Med11 [Chaetomium strumarium]
MNNPPQPPSLSGGPAVDIHQPFTPAERIQQLAEIDNDIASLLTHLSSAMRALATPPGSSVSLLQPNGNGTQADGDTPSDVPILESEHQQQQEREREADPVSAFRTAQASFFNAIDRIDKHLTRQILALEEAGIITLRNNNNSAEQQQQQQQQPQQGDFGPGGGGGGSFGGSGHHQGHQQQLPPHQGGGGGGGDAKARAAAPPRLEPDGMGRYGGLDVGQLNMASSTVERDMEGELWRKAREELGNVVGVRVKQEGDVMEE